MLTFFCISLAALAVAKNSSFKPKKRAGSALTLHINSIDDFCLMAPIDQHTTIGDAEGSGALMAYCTQPVDGQGYISPSFWTHAAVDASPGASGMRQIQITGCIDVASFDRLTPSDGGGQMDSSGGQDGRGMPPGSTCAGYAHYVELIEPDDRRACLRCCDSPDDCDLSHDTAGCPVVIQNGDYSGCS